MEEMTNNKPYKDSDVTGERMTAWRHDRHLLKNILVQSNPDNSNPRQLEFLTDSKHWICLIYLL